MVSVVAHRDHYCDDIRRRGRRWKRENLAGYRVFMRLHLVSVEAPWSSFRVQQHVTYVWGVWSVGFGVVARPTREIAWHSGGAERKSTSSTE